MILDRIFARARPADRLFDPAAWRFLLGYFRGRGGTAAICLGAATGLSLIALPMIPLVRLAFDRAIPRGDIRLLVMIGVGLASLRALAGAVVVATRAQLVNLKSQAILDLRRDLLVRLYDRPFVSHVRSQNQPFATHIVIDAERIDGMIDSVLGTALPAALTCLVLGGGLVLLNAELVLVGAVLVPLVWVVGRLTTRRMHANFRRYHDAYDAFVRGVRFALDNFALTRARAAEAGEILRQTRILEDMRATALHMAVDNVRNGQLQSVIVALAGVVILVVGGAAVGRHAMTVGGLLAFFAAAGVASGQIDRLIATLPAIIEGSAALSRLHAHVTASPRAPYVGRRVLDWSGRLDLEAVEFAYGAAPVLRGVSLRLDPGARVGIVGANGAGKTTILSLILGLYRPRAGRLAADGVAYDALDVRALRRMIGLVPQHPSFFNASLLENVAYGAPEVTRAQVAAAAERLGAEAMLTRLPGGLDAPLGEGGLMLSGGERQMIAILRAIVTRPRLLVLDEPTNHLDAAAVRALVPALAAGPDRPAMLLISHDLAVAEGMDRLFHLAGGHLRALPAAVV